MTTEKIFYRSFTPAIALLVLVLSAASPQAQIGSGARPGPSSVPRVTVFSGKGPTQVPKKAPAPRPEGRAAPSLDLSAIRAAVKASGGKDVSASNEYVTITPGQPFVANKANLYFLGEVFYQPDIIRLLGVIPGTEFTLFLKPAAAGQTYLVDFSVRVYAGETLTYYGPGGTTSASFPDEGGQHLLFLVNSPDVAWKTISIVPTKGPLNFYSCKVTTIQ